MVEPFFRKPGTPQELQLRAQAIQARLDGLSIDELMRGGRAGEPPHLGVGDPHGRGYDHNQPRVPAGHPDGGQWTSKGGGDAQLTGVAEAPRSLDEIISDAIDGVIPGARYAAAASRPPRGPIVINGRSVQLTTRQATRLAEAELAARDAIARVREHDPNWRPRPSAYETVEGSISARQAEAQQARERLAELQYNGIIPGPYFREGMPARGPDRNFRVGERDWMNELFAQHGCHTCGTRDPGTPRGNAILDHQPPTRYNPLRKRQFLLPQCLACSRRQGLWIIQNGGQQ